MADIVNINDLGPERVFCAECPDCRGQHFAIIFDHPMPPTEITSFVCTNCYYEISFDDMIDAINGE